jgi:hypothetical protein
LAIDVAKVNVPSAEMLKSSPPLFCNTNPLPDRPLTVPPTVCFGEGVGPLPGVQAIINNIRKNIIPIEKNLFIQQTVFLIVHLTPRI